MEDNSARVDRVKKPRKCPKCGHYPLASIIYGMPCFSKELQQSMKEGRVALGGCCIGDDDPAWKCANCGLKIFRKKLLGFPLTHLNNYQD